MYVIKSGKRKNDVVGFHSGYAMLPMDVYVLTEKQSNLVLHTFQKYGFKYTKKEFKKGDYGNTIDFKTKEYFDHHFKSFDRDLKMEVKEKEVRKVEITKLMKDKKLIKMWKEEKEIFKIRHTLYGLGEEFDKKIIKKNSRLSVLFEIMKTISEGALDIAKKKEEEIMKYQRRKYNSSLMLGYTEEFKKRFNNGN